MARLERRLSVPTQNSRSDPAQRAGAGGWLDLLLVLVLPVGIVAGIYLAPFLTDRATMPFGVDTSTYIWRTNVVHDLGVSSLTPEATNAPKPLGDRPGYPIVLSLLRSATGMSSLTLMWLAPALFACALGLAAASLAADGAQDRRRRSGVVAVAVSGSAFVAWTAVGYAANLAFDVVAMAAAVMFLEVARGRRGIVGGAVLLAGGILIHAMFATLFVVVLGVAVLALFVRSRLGDGSQDRRLAARRCALMMLLGVGVGIAGLLLAPQQIQRLPDVQPDAPGPAIKMEERLGAMALPLTLPLAGLGACLLALDRRPGRRDAALLLGIWSSVAVASLVAWYFLDLPLPPYRWAAFALAIPASIVLGTFAMGDRLRRSGRRRASVAAALGVAAAIGLASAGASVWWSREPTLTAQESAQLATLSSYLEPLPTDTKVVILLDRGRRKAPFNRAWAGLPADRLPYVTMLAEHLRPQAPGFGLEPELLASDTVVVSLDAYREPTSLGRQLGPGVHLISGATSPGVRAGEPPRAPPGVALGLSTVALLALLVVTGGGWATLLTGLPRIGVASVAPAFGTAVLACIGFAASRLHMPLHGFTGAGLVVAVAVSGWAAAYIGRSRRSAESLSQA